MKEQKCDTPNEFARIVSFCKEYGIAEKRTFNVCNIFEESVNILSRYAYGVERAVAVVLDYAALIYFLLIWLITLLVRQLFALFDKAGRMSKDSLEKMKDNLEAGYFLRQLLK